MNKTELFIKSDSGWSELELSDNVSFPIIFNIADVRDISKRNSSFSKTIQLPHTQKNSNTLDFIFDVANNSTFDVNKKVKCYVLQDTVQVFQGNFQLIKINTSNNRKFEYECVIFSENDSLFKSIESEFLTDLDFSELDHTYDQVTQLQSWTHSYNNGYTYPLIDYNSQVWDVPLSIQQNFGSGLAQSIYTVQVEDLKPAIFIKYIWDKIFADKGFIYDSVFLNSDLFKNLLLPYSLSNPITNSLTFNFNNSIYVGLSASYNMGPPRSSFFNLLVPPTTLRRDSPYPFNNFTVRPAGGGQGGVPAIFAYRSLLYAVAVNDDFEFGLTTSSFPAVTPAIRIPYDDESSPFYDNSNKWNPVSYQYTADSSNVKQRFVLDFDLKVNNPFLLRQNTFTGSLDPNINSLGKYRGGVILFRVLRERNPITNVIVPGGYPVELEAYEYTDILEGQIPQDEIISSVGSTGSFDGKWAFLYSFGQSQNFANRQESFTPFSKLIGQGPDFSPIFGYPNNFGTLTYISDSRNTYEYQSVLQTFDIVEQFIGTASSQFDYDRYKKQIKTIYLDGSVPDRNPLRTGERLWVEFKLIKDFEQLGNDWIDPNSYQFLEGTTMFSEIEPSLLRNQTIDMNSTLPVKFKKTDFLLNIIKMFNLYVDIDRSNPNKYIIEPREDYYELGNIIDWSSKLDISKEISSEIIAEKLNKNILLTYKSDDDLLNKTYQDNFNEVYGEYEYIVDNDFLKGTNKVEVSFSPSPLRNAFLSDIVIPRIISTDTTAEQRKFVGKNPRILLRNYNKTINSQNWWWEGVSYNYYCYAGHFDHPFQGVVDINFGETRELYYQGNFITRNNLFRNYWRDSLDELTNKDSRIVTANFYLTAQDIYDFRFYDQIFVDNLSSGTSNYFKINKIEYDAVKDGSYKVELLKSDDLNLVSILGPSFSDGNPIFRSIDSNVGVLNVGRNVPGGMFNGALIGSENIGSYGGVGFIFGFSNRLLPETFFSSILGGSYNQIGSSGSSIVGGNNNIVFRGADNSFIIGGENNLIKSKNSILIGGKNETLEQENIIKMGSILIGSTNYISASTDEILNPFADDSIINYIDGSIDEIRNLGSFININIISGGTDRV